MRHRGPRNGKEVKEILDAVMEAEGVQGADVDVVTSVTARMYPLPEEDLMEARRRVYEIERDLMERFPGIRFDFRTVRSE